MRNLLSILFPRFIKPKMLTEEEFLKLMSKVTKPDGTIYFDNNKGV